MTRPVVLFGDGQIASAAYWYLSHDSDYRVAAFTVDGAYLRSSELFGLPVVAFEDIANRFSPDDFDMFVTISFQAVNQLRAAKYRQARGMGFRLINYISSTAIIWPGTELGDNCFVRAHAEVGPFARLGSNVVLGSQVLVSHHSTVGDHCYLAAGATVAGSVAVGERCLLGANCTVRDNVRIGSGCVIGAGAVILSDAEENGVYRASAAERLPIESSQLRRI